MDVVNRVWLDLKYPGQGKQGEQERGLWVQSLGEGVYTAQLHHIFFQIDSTRSIGPNPAVPN